MEYKEVENVVAFTMNILEKEYGVEELESFGMPTVYEIADEIFENWDDLSKE